MQSQPAISLPAHFASRDYPRPIQALPKRSLFSPPQKRKRSPSSNTENRTEKSRRLESPTQPNRAYSLQLTSSNTSNSLDEHYKKKLYYNSYPKSSESSSNVALNESSAGNSKSTLGLRRPMTDAEKKVDLKIVWQVRLLITHILLYLEITLGCILCSSIEENWAWSWKV